MKIQRSAIVLAIGLFASLPLTAETIEEFRAANADARVELRAVTGEFTVVGHDEETIELSGTLGSDVEEIRIEGGPEHWTVQFEMKESRGFNLGFSRQSRITLLVPRGGRIEAGVVSAELTLRELDGAEVEAATVSGDVTLENVQPRRLRVESVSGDIESNSGGVERSGVQAVSGDIRFAQVSGDVELKSVSGNIEVQGKAISELNAETVSGDIDARLQPLAEARLRFSSHSGDIAARLPADTEIRIDAETFSGDLRSSLGGQVQRKSRGPGASLEHESGAGGVRVEASTFSGSFSLSALE